MSLVRAASVAVLVGGLVLTGCTPRPPANGGSTPSPTTPSVTTGAPTAPSTTQPSSVSPSSTAEPTSSETAGQRKQALVYFQIDAPNGARLVREPHAVAGGTPARGAVEAMIAGPDDPDYQGPWNPRTRVLGISDSGGVITVDLSADARTANVGSAFASLMKQQLVYTVTEQLGTGKRVMLHIDGEPAGELWGVTDWTSPEPRADWSETLLAVGIDTPAEGASVTSPVAISGQAAVFEATLPWRVLRRDGSTVREGVAMTAEGMTLAPYRFEVTLEPGEYVIEVTEDDPSGGEGGPLDVDSRSFKVAG